MINKNDWEIKKLGGLISVKTGKLDANAADIDGVYPFFTCSQTPLKINKYNFDCECVLIAGNGDLNVKYYKGKFNAYQRTYVITIKENNILTVKFLFKFFTKHIEKLRQQSIGGVIKYIKLANLTDIYLPIPPLPTQHQIVSELDALSDIINKKKQQLEVLDQLAQATFYDMFGDPVSNEKGWEVNIINNIAKIRIGPFGSLLHVEDYVTNGTPLVNPSHMLNGKIIPDYNLTVDSEKIKELSSYLLQEGDLIVGRRGEIGRCALVSSNENGYICGTGSMYVRFNSIINPLFALKTFSSKSMVAKLLEKAKGATMLNINAGSVGSLFFPIPPISLQNQFITKIESIEKQKSLINTSIAEVQQLFNFTMDKYFN